MPSSVLCDNLQDVVFPHLVSVLVGRVRVVGGVVRVTARTRDGTVLSCPDCGSASGRVHSRYERHLADMAVGGRAVVIDLTVRRLFCDASGCPRRTFVEQVPGLSLRYGRYTPSLLELLQAVGLALAGSAGARLLRVLHTVVSRVTVLALVMALPEPALLCPRVLGVDDFALKRGRVYASVLIDGESHRPVDLLPDREAGTLARWLRAHPGAEVICRDRAGAYADGARTGAPDALQVADRWHLWHNLGEAVERCVSAHRGCLREPEDPEILGPAAPPQILELPEPTGISANRPAHRFTDRLQECHAAVHAELATGASMRAVARQLGLGRNTVHKYARAATWQEMFHGQWQDRTSILDPHREYGG